VSRIPGSIELWWVGALGSIEGAFWYQGSTWQRYQIAPVGSATAAGGMAAVSRVPTSMELWWVGALGSIEGAFWYEGSTWQRYQIAPAGSATLTGGIAAVSRIPTSMELWWVGALGSIEGAYWYDESPWQRYQLAPAGSATATSAIAAVSRVPTSMELWWVGADGSVQDGFWYDGGTWQQFTLAPAGSASLTGGIAGVSRIPSSMEVWWIGADESVQDANWYEHVLTLDGIEVTQSIQDLANAVPLVSGKPTVVRVYTSHAISPGVRVWGTLEAQRPGGKPIKLRSRAAVTLDPSRAGHTATLRKDAALSLNFVVPGFLTTPGTLTLALSKLVNEATGCGSGWAVHNPVDGQHRRRSSLTRPCRVGALFATGEPAAGATDHLRAEPERPRSSAVLASPRLPCVGGHLVDRCRRLQHGTAVHQQQHQCPVGDPARPRYGRWR
jgi:hypothetical protein